jgi:DNA-binding CsgD family transcriptional regulator
MDQLWNSIINLQGENLQSYDFTNKLAEYFSPGTFCYYIYNHPEKSVKYVHPNVEKLLGIKPDMINPAKIKTRIFPGDITTFEEKESLFYRFLQKLIPPAKILKYKSVQIVKILNSENNYKDLVVQNVVLSTTGAKTILHTLTIFTELGLIDYSSNNTISFVGTEGEPSFYNIDPKNPVFNVGKFDTIFSKREMEILKLIAKGLDADEISKELFLSESTIRTHRKNILQKSNCNNTAELLAKCTREGLL